MTDWTLECAQVFPRRFRAGDSEAYLTAFDIIVLTRPFTAGDVAVLTWVQLQDDTLLREIAPLKDGRDVIVLRRMHSRQTLADAVQEERRHMCREIFAELAT